MMRTKCWGFFLLFCALGAHVLAAGDAPSRAALSVSMEEYPPYKSMSLPGHGILSALVMAVFQHANIPATLVSTPNNRAISGVRAGIYDASFGWAKSADRERDLYFSDPVMPLNMVLCHQRGKAYTWRKLADLAPWRIGITSGNFYSSEFEDLIRNGTLSVDSANSDVDNMRKLSAGHIEIFPIDAETGPYLLRTQLSQVERDRVECETRAYWSVPMHMVLSRKVPDGPQIMARFNQALADMRRSGEADRIVSDTRNAINR